MTKNKLRELLTVIYYTSNHEKPEFEQKITDNLISTCGDLPIISVSQKPMDLGENICVGDVGLSAINEFRQILLGVKRAKTPFIVFAESDFIYPPDYFTFAPPEKGLYRHKNVWVVFKNTEIAGSFRKKWYSEGAQICHKDLYVEKYEQYLADKPQWLREDTRKEDNSWIVENIPFKFFGGETACVTFKTGDGMRSLTTVLNEPGKGYKKNRLPHWGHVNKLRKQFFS